MFHGGHEVGDGLIQVYMFAKEEIVMSTIHPLSQQDPRWKGKNLGQEQITIGKFGCLLTCMAMVANRYGADETPASLNDKMLAAGGFMGALLIPSVMPRAVPQVRFVKYIPCADQPAPMAEIDATLVAGKPLIVEVDYSPAAGLQNHWVVIYEKKGEDYLIRDPWPYPPETKEVSLTQRYGFAGSPAEVIQAAIWYDGTTVDPIAALPRPSPKAIQDTGFVVYAAADGLALRQQPLVSEANLIKRLPLNAKIFVQEAPQSAKSKIGVLNQWLKVQEAGEGYEGYVAAWYVSTAPQEAPLPQPVSTSSNATAGGDKLPVYATSEGLALRSQPVISEATLIKRLPLNAELVVLEAAAQARQKIGVNGEWLKVRDIEGVEGYAAAWYLSTARQEPSLGVTIAPPAGSQAISAPPPQPDAPLIVRVITEGLALRSQPLVAETTLIKRLPFGAELLILEAPGEAEKKIGVVNQWLKGRDSAGSEGFVAAWYVIKRPASGAL